MSTPYLTGNPSNLCVEGGDAPELEARVNAALQAATGYLADIEITGVGLGPRWVVQLSLVDNSNTDTLVPVGNGQTDAVAYVRRAGSAVALAAAIDAVLAAAPALYDYVAIRVAGGGTGRDYMAVIVMQPGFVA